MKSAIRLLTLTALIIGVNSATALDKPGGLTRTAVGLPTNSYEMLLSPAYTISPAGAYLTSELRFQPSEDLGVGFGFGAGEIGFNFGANGVWFIAPDLEAQPAVSVLGGLYFNRVGDFNYFVVKVTPTVSKNFFVNWGRLTPYAGLNIAPSFRLTKPENQLTLKSSTGIEFAVNSLKGVKVWTEVGIGILNSYHETVVGISYPFSALGE